MSDEVRVVDFVRRPNARVINALEEMLADARSGDLQSLVAVGVCNGMETMSVREGDRSLFMLTLAELEITKHSMIAECREAEIEAGEEIE